MGKRFLYIICFNLLISACSMHKKPDVLSYADALIKTKHADKALVLLKHYNLNMFKTPAERAKYAVLLTQAMDKNKIYSTNDSLIKIGVKYYDETNNVEWQARAHYYWGTIYLNKDSALATAREFLYALPLAKKTTNYNLLCCIEANLAYVCYYNNLYNEANSFYHQEFVLEKRLNDYEGMALCMNMISTIERHNKRKNYKRIERILKSAYSLTNKFNNKLLTGNIISDLSTLYAEMNNMPLSMVYANRGIEYLKDFTYPNIFYLIKGYNYTQMKQYDSATYFLKKALPHSSIYTKIDAYRDLLYIARKQRNANNVIQYGDLYAQYKDSVRLSEHPVEIEAALKDMIYKQSQKEYESFLFRYKVLLFASIGIIVLALWLMIYIRNKKKEKLKNLVTRYGEMSKEMKAVKDAFDKSKRELDMLHKKLQSAQTEERKQYYEEMLELQLQQQKKLSDELEMQNKEIARIRKGSVEDVIQSSPIYLELKEIIKKNIPPPDGIEQPTNVQWRKLKDEMNTILGFEFDKTLGAKYKRLTEDDICFCCLVRIGFKYTEMAIILNKVTRSIYNHSDKIKQRMGLSPESKIKDVLCNI